MMMSSEHKFFPQSKTESDTFLSSTEQSEKAKHLFQDFLYSLRSEGLRVSTSEWLDLQETLSSGEIQSLDDLYFIGRALLVKDVTGYASYDTVFGRVFFGIEPPLESAEDEDVSEDFQEEQESIQKESEDIEEVVEATSFTSEDVHGGKEATKDIKESPSAANDGLQENNKGAEIGKNATEPSAKKLVLERKFDQFDEHRLLNKAQLGRALVRLVTVIQENTYIQTPQLDVRETIDRVASNAGLPEFIFKEESEDKPKVILMFDVGGSTDEFRPIMEQLFAGAKDVLQDLEVFYFHNAIYGEVWPQKDGNWGEHFISLNKIMQRDSNHKIIIIGDAWMAREELPQAALDDFSQLKNAFPSTVWINPIRAAEHDNMDGSGSIADIKGIFPMFDLTLSGIEEAVKTLLRD